MLGVGVDVGAGGSPWTSAHLLERPDPLPSVPLCRLAVVTTRCPASVQGSLVMTLGHFPVFQHLRPVRKHVIPAKFDLHPHIPELDSPGPLDTVLRKSSPDSSGPRSSFFIQNDEINGRGPTGHQKQESHFPFSPALTGVCGWVDRWGID